jgi:hypothetical protein
MITSLITFAGIAALPLLLATAVTVLSHDPQRRADAKIGPYSALLRGCLPLLTALSPRRPRRSPPHGCAAVQPDPRSALPRRRRLGAMAPLRV